MARQVYVAHSGAEAEDALAQLAAFTRRIIEVSRSPDSQRGSHVLSYADTQEHALYGTPDEVCAGLQALSESGVSYVLLQLPADPRQLRRIAHEVIAPDGALQ